MMRWVRSTVAQVRDDLRVNNGAPPLDRETTSVFVLGTVLLTVFYYYGKASGLEALGLREAAEQLWPAWASDHVGMIRYVYWGLASFVLRVAVPVAVIVFVFRASVRDYGLEWRGQWKHVPIYVGLYAFMLPFLVVASGWSSFQETYPFYDNAGDRLSILALYSAAYALQFVGVEFFFRGFLLFPLFRKLGYHALLITAIPYVMIHFNKPVSETIGALIAGLVLGYLALRARSCLLGIGLHVAIALTMDLLSLVRRAGSLDAFLTNLVAGA